MSKKMLIADIVEIINGNNKITKKNLLKNVEKIYNTIYDVKKNPYNEFVKAQMAKLKDSDIPNKEKMAHIGKLWAEEKAK